MPFADVADLRTHYRVEGPPDAPVLVLSNSLGTSLDMWAPQMAELQQRYCVLRYDTRGHGYSGVAPGPYSIAQFGGDVLALADHLGIERFSFCGLSMGGMIGQWLGVNAPQRLISLVLCNTAAMIGPADVWNTRIARVKEGGMAAITDAVVARWFSPSFIASNPAAVERLRAQLLATPPAGYVGACAAVRDMDQRDAIGWIRVATLVIGGKHDLVTTPADCRFLAERVAGARLVELSAAHISNVESAPEFTAALVDFLNRP